MGFIEFDDLLKFSSGCLNKSSIGFGKLMAKRICRFRWWLVGTGTKRSVGVVQFGAAGSARFLYDVAVDGQTVPICRPRSFSTSFCVDNNLNQAAAMRTLISQAAQQRFLQQPSMWTGLHVVFNFVT